MLVSPAAPTIAPGQSLALNVEMQDASGRDVTGQPEAWSTSDSTIATVDDNGIVTAHALGSAKIFVASGIQSAFADVSVSNAPPVPHWVSVSPSTVQVSVRSTVALFASVTDAGGHIVADVPVTWTSSNSTLATVDTSGDITGVAPGSVNIVAHVGSNQATTQVRVVTGSTVAAPAPPPPAPVTPPPGAGTLFGSYSATSPHWPHIRTMMTDFYYAWNSAERSWAGQHYDYAMSGTGGAWRTANATVNHMPYAIVWSVIIPNVHSSSSLGTVYYADMVAWYRAHPAYNIENAFVHLAGAHDSAGRKSVMIWDSQRWIINPADPGSRAYQVDRFQRLTAGEGGAFVDEASSDMTGQTRGSQEFPRPSDFEAPQTATFAAIKRGMGNKMLMLNTAEYTTAFDRANLIAAGAAHLERMNNAFFSGMAQRWEWVESLMSQGVVVDFVTTYSSRYVNTIPSTFPHGNSATSAQRMKLWELASYYMVVPSSPEKLVLQLENEWSLPYSSLWTRAQEANIGHPLSARVLASRGTDPLGQSYAVYTRDMDKALVIMRVNQGWGSHSYSEGSAVTIPLPSTDQWVPLNADGTLGSPVTSVTLRNVEAAILLKKSRL
ncbi:MAG: Ig-like domain-containing protein [Gemmatimonadota bacterium]|nr:Ig-like domain-containing protein [Gemmatimonadota bacterium]